MVIAGLFGRRLWKRQGEGVTEKMERMKRAHKEFNIAFDLQREKDEKEQTIWGDVEDEIGLDLESGVVWAETRNTTHDSTREKNQSNGITALEGHPDSIRTNSSEARNVSCERARRKGKEPAVGEGSDLGLAAAHTVQEDMGPSNLRLNQTSEVTLAEKGNGELDSNAIAILERVMTRRNKKKRTKEEPELETSHAVSQAVAGPSTHKQVEKETVRTLGVEAAVTPNSTRSNSSDFQEIPFSGSSQGKLTHITPRSGYVDWVGHFRNTPPREDRRRPNHRRTAKRNGSTESMVVSPQSPPNHAPPTPERYSSLNTSHNPQYHISNPQDHRPFRQISTLKDLYSPREPATQRLPLSLSHNVQREYETDSWSSVSYPMPLSAIPKPLRTVKSPPGSPATQQNQPVYNAVYVCRDARDVSLMALSGPVNSIPFTSEAHAVDGPDDLSSVAKLQRMIHTDVEGIAFQGSIEKSSSLMDENARDIESVGNSTVATTYKDGILRDAHWKASSVFELPATSAPQDFGKVPCAKPDRKREIAIIWGGLGLDVVRHKETDSVMKLSEWEVEPKDKPPLYTESRDSEEVAPTKADSTNLNLQRAELPNSRSEEEGFKNAESGEEEVEGGSLNSDSEEGEYEASQDDNVIVENSLELLPVQITGLRDSFAEHVYLKDIVSRGATI
jgi:hypothetical protein